MQQQEEVQGKSLTKENYNSKELIEYITNGTRLK